MMVTLDPKAVIVGSVSTAILGYILLYVISELGSSSAAPDPGDPLYDAWLSIGDSTATAITLIAGGSVFILLWIIFRFRRAV